MLVFGRRRVAAMERFDFRTTSDEIRHFVYALFRKPA